jgi:hypothetical protein
MTRVTTECPRCGRIKLDIDDITLVECSRQGSAWYLFDCLGCAHRVVTPASNGIVTALVSANVRRWTVPAEALERVTCPDAEPIRVDEVLDALLWLRDAEDLSDHL